jgi:serine/threonine-protein kinase HipA
MTPLYDVLSTCPIMGNKANHLSWHDAKLAMAFRAKSAHYKLKDIYPRHFHAVANKLGLGGAVNQILEEIVAATPTVISKLGSMLPEGFPPRVADTVFSGLKESAKKIQRAV